MRPVNQYSVNNNTGQVSTIAFAILVGVKLSAKY